MKIDIIQRIAPDSATTIVTACLSAPDEYVMLLSSGDVIRYKINSTAREHLFSVKSPFSYEDGGFDISAPSTIYTLDDIVVLVNDYKRHGYIHYPGKYSALHLWRKDYHADISRYPIALFRDQQQVPYIIYAVDWNHLQIMNLDTRQVVTAAKSLIEEGAEERHIAFYKTYEETNKLPWPSSYDYFYGQLQMSPDGSQFLSAGWVWGSSDCYKIYNVDHFIHSPRIADKRIDSWEHNNRGVCWINDNTVAVTFHPVKDDDEDAPRDAPCEIHFYHVAGSTAVIDRKIKIADADILNTSMYYSQGLKAIVIFGNPLGLIVVTPDGEVIFRDKGLQVAGYHAATDLLLEQTDEGITVYRMEL
jgi:hypothetical protein